ncbi:MAG: hypothetical protein IPF92_26715 [Myxococcales bacterium]|jgi:hypothetical protein|nr:hypothetical protein [Myxococcales bacterium]MBL0194146.1 hypothetical protein [Myxococcales bacterium]HQY60262.1 hypothetical protein [Polyangiaceae bacterium]
MQFADARATSIAYLILRHLYDGDVIEWPIAEADPHAPIFAGLEAQGYVARWDRVWPLADRYRLTEKGIALIESVYRPAGADAFFEEVRRQNLAPQDRRNYLANRRLDPQLWPLLHDPSTHWSTYATTGSRYQAYMWEDHRPPKRRRPPAQPAPARGGGGVFRGGGVRVHHVIHHHHDRHHPAHLVDLDREADQGPAAPTGHDYDVS